MSSDRPSNRFATARNLTTAACEVRMLAPAFVVVAPAMAMMTMAPEMTVPMASFYAEAYRRALAVVAARRSAERRAGKIVFATARN